MTLTLAAQALRLTAVPELTRTNGAVAGSYAAAILVLGVPGTLLAWVHARAPVAELLTGKLPEEAATLAAEALPWLVGAAVVQVLAALAAATLAARDRFVAAAVGFSLGGIAGLVVFILLADEHGLVSPPGDSRSTPRSRWRSRSARYSSRGATSSSSAVCCGGSRCSPRRRPSRSRSRRST